MVTSLILVLGLMGAPPEPVIGPIQRTVAPGSVVWVPLRLRRRDLPKALWVVAVGSGDGSARFLSPAMLDGVDRRGAQVRIPLVVSASARSGRRVVARGTVALVELGQDRPLHRLPIERKIRVGSLPSRADETLEEAVAAHAAWLAFADATREALPATEAARNGIELHRGPRPSRMDKKDRAAWQDLSRARLEAFAARERIRAVALATGEATPIEALAKLERDLEAPSRRGPSGATIGAALKGVESALTELRFLDLRRDVQALRARDTVRPGELARILMFEGLLSYAEGRRSAASARMGQALCLDPGVAPLRPLPAYFELALTEARRTNPCRAGQLQLRLPRARRVKREGRRRIEVDVQVDQDPFSLGVRVRVERFGLGGASAEERVVELDEAGQAVAVFDESETVEGLFPVRATLFDAYGLKVARVGDPDPIRLQLEDGEGVGGFEIPDWAWWVGGGVLLIGAAAATAIVVGSENELRRAIGPLRVDF